MDCVYRNQRPDFRTGVSNAGCGSQNLRYPSGMMGYPVAMAYVPWQQWKTPYDPAKGLSRGTIFEDLDLPFEKERCRGV